MIQAHALLRMLVRRKFVVLLGAWLCASAPSASVAEALLPGETAGQPIESPATRVPQAGSAAYYITHELYQGAPQVSGVFYLTEGSPEGEHRLIALRAHYSVLSVEGDAVRLLVRAQPVDPRTRALLEPVRWEATYLLTAGGSALESINEVPFPYSDLMQPGSLVEWSAVLGEFAVTMELAFSAVRDASDAVWLE